MTTISNHLELLLSGPVREPGDVDKRALHEWTKLSLDVPEYDPMLDAEDATEVWESVTGVFNGTESLTNDSQAIHSIVSRLESKPHVVPLFSSIAATLSSTRPNDEISGEIAELVGFDDLELIMEILGHRHVVARKLWGAEEMENSVSHARETGNQYQHLTQEGARRRMETTFRENAARPLFSGTAQAAFEILPHVYTSNPMAQGNVLSQFGSKYMLPLGTIRHSYEDFEEVVIPPARVVPPRTSERLIPVSELDPLARGSFPGYTSLNRIQSIVYPTAYGSNENMLICAPTGAGKTDVAMLSILRVIGQHRHEAPGSTHLASTIRKEDFKVIYVAPMKALASEIVRKLGKRLAWLSIQVRELTGDMQLTKAEIAQTQIIVTTPEKWDVVTRKPTGEGELASSLKLLIIDEVHLLNEERGAVIETIVARTLRQVESSQSIIRIVGLSATLPNYIDVAEFLSVSRYKGLFYFDSSFRPVPLEQHFLGIKGKAGSSTSRKNLDRVTYQKVSELVAQGHQVMVFVHARKETVKAAMSIKESATLEGNLVDFSCEEHPQWNFFRREIGDSRNKEMKQLFNNGFGIHHAGMLRSDRNMMERMFEARAIKVLCCTATLAWGVNLPAHAVIIKGTQVYDSGKGAFVDLSVLDVLQVFGRAGRPGLETSGEGYICTTEDKLTHYLDAVTSQLPIESQFNGGMIDSLNAEISLGTVANTHDAVQWLGYTYLFVRMRKNPFVYGIAHDATVDDPQLGSKRLELVTAAARKLAEARMIIFDQGTGAFTITDLGRIAAKYYIKYTSIEIYNKEFKFRMTEADVLAMLCMSTEFEQIQVRESEVEELKQIMDMVPCDVKDKTDTSQGKVNILLQGFISKLPVDDFALVSDMAYAAQNGGRIVRALLEIAISRKWANVTAVLMGMSKAIEKRLWPFDQPLKQFSLKSEVFYGLERWADEWTVSQLAQLSAFDLGKLIHMNETHGAALLTASKQFPTAKITYDLRPLGEDVLKIVVRVGRAFDWSSKVHGSAEPFWLWVEDFDGSNILQLSHLIFRQTSETLKADFIISIPSGQPPPSVTIRFVSDRWMGAEEEVVVPFDSLVMPPASNTHSSTLDLPFLSTSVLRNPMLENVFSSRLSNFNSIQTQNFWSMVNTNYHSLLCAPVGSGKSMLAQLLIWSTIFKKSKSWILVVAPRRSVAADIMSELRIVAQAIEVSLEFSNDQNVFHPTKGKIIRVVTADNLLYAVTRQNGPFNGLDLVVCENLEQLNSAYELGVSLLRHATQSSPTRYVGLSSSLNDPGDLAAWLGVDASALHSYHSKDRDQSLSVDTQTFTIPHSTSLFKAMAKSAHSACKSSPAGGSSIVFVPSRGQCRGIAQDLITQCALEVESGKGYLPEDISEIHLEDYLVRLHDKSLVDLVSRGVGIFHEGIHRSDRHLMLELYAEGIIRVMLVPRDACWTVPLRAAVVVVMGTQYVHIEGNSERQIRDYSLTELIRMQSRAVQPSAPGHFYLFCQAESKDTFRRFLDDGLPLESELLETTHLQNWYSMQPKPVNRQNVVDMLGFTFLVRRMAANPTYYDCLTTSLQEDVSRLVDRLRNTN